GFAARDLLLRIPCFATRKRKGSGRLGERPPRWYWGGWVLSHSASAPEPFVPRKRDIRHLLRRRTAAPARDRRRCGTRSAPRTRAHPRPEARSRGATWRSSRNSARARRAAVASRAPARVARRRRA